jgi:molecular chaperone DnaK
MGSYIGIDLGTTFSAVAALDEAGRPIIINNNGANITPSCVLIKESKDAATGDVERDVVVGEQARRAMQLSDNAAGRFKRHMGTDKVYTLCGKEFTPTQLSAAVLSKLKNVAEQELGTIAEAVVTVPANFAQEAREATLEAAKIAGLNVKHIINEPTAAALYYAYHLDSSMSGIFAVYDLGGGTFDVSIVKVQGHDVEVLATCGVQKLGGDDFDNAIIEVVAEKYRKVTGQAFAEEDYTLNDAEEDKIALSSSKRVIAGGGNGVDDQMIQIKRSEFEGAISSLIAQTEMLCETAVDDAGVELSQIQSVFLAGGSTRIPCVTESIEKVFRQKPVSIVNVDEVVALGSILYACHKGNTGNLNALQAATASKMCVQERTALNFGTIILSTCELTRKEELQNSVIISRGEQIPCEVTKPYATMYENQTAIECTVTESSQPETDPRFVKVIWEGNLDLPPNRPAGLEVKVTYSYDGNQVMNCTFLDVQSDKRIEAMIRMGASSEGSSSIEDMLVIE